MVFISCERVFSLFTFFCPDFFVQVANWVDKKAKFNFQDVQAGKQKNTTMLS